MCLSCGCGESTNDHGDSRNITLLELRCAAEAAGISTATAAAHIAAAFPPESEAVVEVVEVGEADPVLKALEVGAAPKRFVLGVAYPADKLDGHGEFMRPDELERTAWDYARNHRRIGFYHADGTEGHADVVESYIYRGPDWVTTDIGGQEQVIKAGYWVLGAILDEPGFDLVRSRRADGWSVGGADLESVARRRKAAPPSQ